ncbi:MAG: energy transducer TonB [Acidobacteriota bacterium]
MFENLVECSNIKKKEKKWLYFVVTSIVWSLTLVGAIITGIFLYNAQLDGQLALITMVSLPSPPPPPAPPAGDVAAVKQKQSSANTQVVAPTNVAVREVPREIAPPTLQPVAHFPTSGEGKGGDGVFGGVPGGIPGGTVGGDLLGVIGGSGTGNPPDPPKPVAPTVEEQPKTPSFIKRSEGVIRGNAINKPLPIYPQLARASHIEGPVQVEIMIGEDGTVISAKVISGHLLLQQAALQAARQWKFIPTLLNNSPVKVQGIVTFNFNIN